MSQVTLKEGIEKAILAEVPEIKQVLDATDHASGTTPYYQG
jgi:Fe/S biogenesis protein NfuA